VEAGEPSWRTIELLREHVEKALELAEELLRETRMNTSSPYGDTCWRMSVDVMEAENFNRPL